MDFKQVGDDTIINMDHVAHYGFKIMDEGAVNVNVTFVNAKVAVFPYDNVDKLASDWPELEKPIKAWIEQGLG